MCNCFYRFQKGKNLISKKNNGSSEIEQQLAILEIQHNALIASADTLKCNLEKAKEIVEFNNLTKKIETWITNTVSIFCVFMFIVHLSFSVPVLPERDTNQNFKKLPCVINCF